MFVALGLAGGVETGRCDLPAPEEAVDCGCRTDVSAGSEEAQIGTPCDANPAFSCLLQGRWSVVVGEASRGELAQDVVSLDGIKAVRSPERLIPMRYLQNLRLQGDISLSVFNCAIVSTRLSASQ